MNCRSLSDAELIAYLREGEEYAFSEIYRRYWYELFQCAWKRIKDEDMAKDIVQDVFVYCWDKRGGLSVDNLQAWLKTAVKYQVFKRSSRNKVGEHLYELPFNMAAESRADDLVRTVELNSAIDKVVGNLPDKMQEIFRLRYEKNLTTDVIAKELGISRKTVQNQLTKASHNIHLSINHLLVLLFLLIAGHSSTDQLSKGLFRSKGKDGGHIVYDRAEKKNHPSGGEASVHR